MRDATRCAYPRVNSCWLNKIVSRTVVGCRALVPGLPQTQDYAHTVIQLR